MARRAFVRTAVANQVHDLVEERLAPLQIPAGNLSFGYALAEDILALVRGQEPDTGRNLDRECYGTLCKVAPTWRARLSPTPEDETGGTWLGACGRHLAWVCDQISDGENVDLDVERIRASLTAR